MTLVFHIPQCFSNWTGGFGLAWCVNRNSNVSYSFSVGLRFNCLNRQIGSGLTAGLIARTIFGHLYIRKIKPPPHSASLFPLSGFACCPFPSLQHLHLLPCKSLHPLLPLHSLLPTAPFGLLQVVHLLGQGKKRSSRTHNKAGTFSPKTTLFLLRLRIPLFFGKFDALFHLCFFFPVVVGCRFCFPEDLRFLQFPMQGVRFLRFFGWFHLYL